MSPADFFMRVSRIENVIPHFHPRTILPVIADNGRESETRKRDFEINVTRQLCGNSPLEKSVFPPRIGSAYGSRTRAPALRGLCPNH